MNFHQRTSQTGRTLAAFPPRLAPSSSLLQQGAKAAQGLLTGRRRGDVPSALLGEEQESAMHSPCLWICDRPFPARMAPAAAPNVL